jgi:hypothetical protein
LKRYPGAKKDILDQEIEKTVALEIRKYLKNDLGVQL